MWRLQYSCRGAQRCVSSACWQIIYSRILHQVATCNSSPVISLAKGKLGGHLQLQPAKVFILPQCCFLHTLLPPGASSMYYRRLKISACLWDLLLLTSCLLFPTLGCSRWGKDNSFWWGLLWKRPVIFLLFASGKIHVVICTMLDLKISFDSVLHSHFTAENTEELNVLHEVSADFQ